MIEEREEEQPERDLEELEEAGDRVAEDIEEAKQDWESSDIPGAEEPEE